MAAIDLIGGPYTPPRSSLEYAFYEQAIVPLTDIGFVLNLFFWNYKESICEAYSQQKLPILHQHDHLLEILLALQILLIVSTSWINIGDCISSFDSLRDEGAFSIGFPLGSAIGFYLDFLLRTALQLNVSRVYVG